MNVTTPKNRLFLQKKNMHAFSIPPVYSTFISLIYHPMFFNGVNIKVGISVKSLILLRMSLNKLF